MATELCFGTGLATRVQRIELHVVVCAANQSAKGRADQPASLTASQHPFKANSAGGSVVKHIANTSVHIFFLRMSCRSVSPPPTAGSSGSGPLQGASPWRVHAPLHPPLTVLDGRWCQGTSLNAQHAAAVVLHNSG
jgi:hypothetical protein